MRLLHAAVRAAQGKIRHHVLMERRMFSWFLRMSIRWKLQLVFVVTMITTIFNRLLATHELSKMIEIARADQVPAAVLAQMMDNRSTYIFNSFWESGLGSWCSSW